MSEPQFILFGEGADRLQTPVRAIDPGGRARRMLKALFETLRSADRMPPTDKELREWRMLVPQMSNWYPPEERQQVIDAFHAEVERLERAA